MKYRQRFKTIAKDPENTAKVESEREDIELCIKTIKDSELYKKLDEKNQSRINKAIEDKKYHIGFEGLEVKIYDWQKLTDVMGIKKRTEKDANGNRVNVLNDEGKEINYLDINHTYFSFYSHPTYVSVFQFKDAFSLNGAEISGMNIYNVKIAFFMFSIFIADYIKAFPSVKKTFEEMESMEQIMINYFNTFIRGYDYSINEAYKLLD